MPAALGAAATAAAILAWPAGPTVTARLGSRAAAPTPPAAVRGRRRRWVVAAAVAGTLALPLVASMTWTVVATGIAALAVLRRGHHDRAVHPELPLVVDLYAACLRSGATVAAALEAAAAAAGPDIRRRIDDVVRSLRSGAEIEVAWTGWTADPELAGVARASVRTSRSGAAMSEELGRIAARLRERRRSERRQAAARSGVWLVLPLGLCFLPAFVLVGVVPVAVGLLGRLH